MEPVEWVAATVLAAGCLPLIAVALRGRSRGVRRGVIVGWLLVSFTAFGVAKSYHELPLSEQEITNRPIEVEENGYVSSSACGACHPEQHATWHGSYHRTMTRIATPESVVGRFDGAELDAFGHKVRFERRGETFYANLPAPDGPGESDAPGEPQRVSYPIVLTTGLHHMQVYWYSRGDGRRLELAPMVYLMETQRWVPEGVTYLRPPRRALPALSGQWNKICQQCHATGVQPRLEGSETIDTKVAEFGIACEACHGPGEEHARLNHDPRRRYELHLGGEGDPSIVNPRRLSANLSAHVCGQCHSIGTPIDRAEMSAVTRQGFSYRPGDDLTKTRWMSPGKPGGERMERLLKFNPRFLEERFWSDGMVRVSGREYLGLLATPCYEHQNPAKGILTCLSCHSMHKPAADPQSIGEWADDQLLESTKGNEACLQCHEEYRHDLRAHTFHEPRSSGSLCYNCHMPYTSYGLLKAIRSHTIDSPTVASSLATGRPNACNQCHLDKTLQWTADNLQKQYGIPPPQLSRDERAIAASILWITSGDAGQRALMAWSMGWSEAREVSGTSWMPVYLAQLLVDPYDAVRYIAYRSLRRFPGYGDLEYDFLGPPERRTAAMGRAFEMWRGRGNPSGRAGGELLIGPDGRLDQTTWSRLLEKRDDRRVYLEE